MSALATASAALGCAAQSATVGNGSTSAGSSLGDASTRLDAASPDTNHDTSTSANSAEVDASSIADAPSNPRSSNAASTGGTGSSQADAADAEDITSTLMDAGPIYTGPTTAVTVTLGATSPTAALAPGFAGFSFEKTQITDGFFTASNGPLIALFKLLGPGVVRIGADDVDGSTWVPSAQPVTGDQTSYSDGTSDVDSLAAFLATTDWKAIYGVSMRASIQSSVAEAVYVNGRLGDSLQSIEIGNEINYFSNDNLGTPTQQWDAYATAIRAALPSVPLAGPAAGGDVVTSFTAPFAAQEVSKLSLLTQHYYKGAASSDPTLSDLLATDPNVVTESTQLEAAVQSNHIADGFRWGEMNSYSGHGAPGISDSFASALWAIDFMLTTAMHGASGVNFHGGGQNMDGNVCNNGPTSCTRPFVYSPIDEANAAVTGAAPLYYGMLLVSQAGVGPMPATTVNAGSLPFSAYAVSPADGSTRIVLVNKDGSQGANVHVELGRTLTEVSAIYLQAPSLGALTGVTLGGAEVTAAGTWSPEPPYGVTPSGTGYSIVVPPGSAALINAR